MNPLLGKLLNSAKSSNGQGLDLGQLVSLIPALLQSQGGLQGLASKFQSKGLSEIFSSWVSNGPNQGINPEQVEQVLGGHAVQGLASQLGASVPELKQKLAQILPGLINGLTPSGHVEPSSGLNLDSGSISSLLRGILK